MSPYADWDPSLLTGDRDVDDQHMSLFELVNEMHKLIAEGQGREAVDHSIDVIVDYVHTHFAFEEALMERISFPGLEDQMRQHRDFAEQVESLRTEMRSGHVISPTGLLDFMRAWLLGHIGTEDRKIGEYIRSYGQ